MRTLSVRLPDRLDRRLDEEARDEGRSRSELAREAIVEYVEKRERQRFLATLAAEARALRDAAEGRRVAEEMLPMENEALAAVESADADSADDAGRWWD